MIRYILTQMKDSVKDINRLMYIENKKKEEK
jgi:hypothetical protein